MSRRRVLKVEAGPPQPPPGLAVCVVEDWTAPGETTGGDAEDAATRRAALAWRRWREARAEWAATHAIDWRELAGGGQTPHWSG